MIKFLSIFAISITELIQVG